MPKYNIAIINFDDMGKADFLVQPHPANSSNAHQNLNKMRSQGLIVWRYLCPSSICSPSRAGVLTGWNPAELGILTTLEGGLDQNLVVYIDEALPTLSRALQDDVYATGAFGKWHMGRDPAFASCFEYGFDELQGSNFPADEPGATSGKLGAEFISLAAAGTLAYARDVDELIMDKALDFIDTADGNNDPFFVMINLYTPHEPLNPSTSDLDAVDQLAGAQGQVTPAQTYQASIHGCDRQFDRFYDHLVSLGILEETIIIMTADNGPGNDQLAENSWTMFGRTGNFRGRKGEVLNGGVMVPFVIRGPSIPQDKVMETATVSGIDLAPSLCAMVGVEWPGEGGGEDRSRVFYGKDEERETPIGILSTESDAATLEAANRGLPVRRFFPAAGPDGNERIDVFYRPAIGGDPAMFKVYDADDQEQMQNIADPNDIRASRYQTEMAATVAWFESLGDVVGHLSDPDNWGLTRPYP